MRRCKSSGLDGERANSWASCKRRIERVEPFFVCALGQRYGWTPPAEEISDEDDRRAYAGLSSTEMEVRHAVLSGKLRRRSPFSFRAGLPHLALSAGTGRHILPILPLFTRLPAALVEPFRL